MASSSLQALSERPHPLLTRKRFFDLSPEVRVMIYQHVFSVLKISCTDLPDPRPTAVSPFINLVNPGLDLLYVSKEVHNEAQPIFDSAPVVLTGHPKRQVNPSEFPQHVLRRIQRVNLICHDYVLFLPETPSIFNSFDFDMCPNLQVIWLQWAPSFFAENLDFPIESLVPLIQKLLVKSFDKSRRKESDPDLLDSFLSEATSPNTRLAVQKTDTLVKDRDLTIKTYYKFAITGYSKPDWPDSDEEDRFFDHWWRKVLIIWDKTGVRVEGLPDLKHGHYWRDRVCLEHDTHWEPPVTLELSDGSGTVMDLPYDQNDPRYLPSDVIPSDDWRVQDCDSDCDCHGRAMPSESEEEMYSSSDEEEAEEEDSEEEKYTSSDEEGSGK